MCLETKFTVGMGKLDGSEHRVFLRPPGAEERIQGAGDFRRSARPSRQPCQPCRC